MYKAILHNCYTFRHFSFTVPLPSLESIMLTDSTGNIKIKANLILTRIERILSPFQCQIIGYGIGIRFPFQLVGHIPAAHLNILSLNDFLVRIIDVIPANRRVAGFLHLIKWWYLKLFTAGIVSG